MSQMGLRRILPIGVVGHASEEGKRETFGDNRAGTAVIVPVVNVDSRIRTNQ